MLTLTLNLGSRLLAAPEPTDAEPSQTTSERIAEFLQGVDRYDLLSLQDVHPL